MKNRNNIFAAILAVTACFALLPGAQALSPAPDGCYPNFTTAEGCNALGGLTTGAGNTGVGWFALFSAGAGNFNTGVGGGALVLNTGDSNTAVGAAALLLNTTGTLNTAVGTDALVFNDIGSSNTATGAFALENNISSGNTANGSNALGSNTAGTFNTAIGGGTLNSNTDGNGNTAVGVLAIGAGAAGQNTIGPNNVAVGHFALQNNVIGGASTAVGAEALSNALGASNIALGNQAGSAVINASNVIAIGSPGDDVGGSCFIGNIFGVTTDMADAVPVLIDSVGQLGTMNSSQRFKKDIVPMESTSSSILELKPVTFHYKSDKRDTPQFGLIAEQVAKVNPDLVVRDKDGQMRTVRYDAVNAMLLNEFLKEHNKVQTLEATVAQQQKGMEVLTAQLKEQAAQIQKVSAQVEMAKPATKVAVGNQ